jgi:hypothetical protein
MDPRLNKEDHPLIHAFTNRYPLIKQAQTRIEKQALIPIENYILQLARDKGKGYNETRDLLDLAPTLYHITTEGAAAFRSVMEEDVSLAELALDEAKLNMQVSIARDTAKYNVREAKLLKDLAKAKTDRLKAKLNKKLGALEATRESNKTKKLTAKWSIASNQVTQAQVQLDLYDRYQATGKLVTLTQSEADALNTANKSKDFKEGSFYQPLVAGGIDLVTANKLWVELQKIFSSAELEKISRLTADAYEYVNLERTKADLVSREQQKRWFDFVSYVPLMTQARANSISGNHATGYIANPTKADYRRNGSQTPAVGALSLLRQIVPRAAEEIGSRDFTTQLHKYHGELAATGNTFGLKRFTLNDDETGPRSKSPNARRLYQQAGFIHRTKEHLDKNGNIVPAHDRNMVYKSWIPNNS